MEQDNHSDEQIRKILEMKNVAVIGMSRHSEKAAHFVPKYLAENGFNITPVNPTADEILEKKCFKESKNCFKKNYLIIFVMILLNMGFHKKNL